MTIQTDGINKDSYGNKEIQEGRLVYAADAESTDTYVISLQPAATEMVTGMVIHFYCTTANTGAATLNVNGLGAKTIKKNHDQDLATGDIEAGQILTVVYDGTNFQMQSQSATAVETGDSPTFVTVYGTTFDTNVAAAGVTLAGTTLAADGTDENISLTLTPKGTGTVNADGVVINGGTNTFNIANGTASLDVAAGATVNVDANLTVSGAATISETPPLNANVIKGDGTAGRSIRSTRLLIENGTEAAHIKVTSASWFNGDANAVQDNIGKDAVDTGVYNLDATGSVLKLLNAGISGTIVQCLSGSIMINYSGTAINVSPSGPTEDMILTFSNAATGAAVDLATLVDTGPIYVLVAYVTTT